jgi:hypothetical protein
MGPTGSVASPNRSLMIVLSYLYLLVLIPFLVEKNDPEVQWHAKNGLVLTIAEFAFHFSLFILNLALSRISSAFGCVFSILAWLWVAGFVALRIVCIIKGTSGQRFIVPGVSQYTSRF